MKYEIVPNSCRVCLRKNKKLRCIYEPHEAGDERPAEMLRLITGCAAQEQAQTEKDLLPKCICKSCELSLNLAWQFRTRALKSQRLIEIYCGAGGKSKASSNVVELMLDVKQESDEEDEEHFMEIHESLEEVCMREEQLYDDNKQLKIETLEMSYADGDEDEMTEYLDEDDEDEEAADSYLDADTCAEEDPELDEHVTHDEYEQQAECSDYEVVELPRDRSLISNGAKTISEPRLQATPEDDRVIEELRKELETLEDMLEATRPISSPKKSATIVKSSHNIGAKQSATSLVKSQRGRKPKCVPKDVASGQNEPVTSEEVSSVSSVVTLKVVTKRSNAKKVYEESGHICDVCGNIYEKRGRMMEHRRRHDKELRFACELCDKRFHLREKLRKHMFSHSGGKPFKCSFCSCSFFYESVKKAHEAVHNGHKPYVCEECNKAFAYSHTLKKHKLIHADIKLYHCKYCDKDFRLLHHMKQHEETKIHQNTMRTWEEEAAATATKDGIKASTATV